MGWLSRLFNAQGSAVGEVTTGELTLEELTGLLGLAHQSSSGEKVTPDAAIKVATVYRCVDLIAGGIKSLPFKVFERIGDAHQDTDHEYNWLFNERANAEMSSADAWQYLMVAKFFYGDGYAELLRARYRNSRIVGWRPLHPNKVEPFRDKPGGTKYYRVTREDGSQDILDVADVIQLTSLGYDGLTSPSPITYAAREAVGNAVAAQKWSGKFFHEGATFDYALKTAARLNESQLKDLRASLAAKANGSRAPLILSGGLEPAQLSINPKDAEILASRLFTVQEICRIFGVPPHMVGHTEKSTSWQSGLEAMGTGFVRYTLLPHLTQIAQEFNYKLWPKRSRYFLEHVTAALERGDVKSRYEAYRSALGRAGEPGWMKINEVRRRENLPPDPDGDALWRPDQAAPELPEGGDDE
ncbi:phage portal protein [Parasalinivibrio latis]|uniref:phage portal protein n=1 Tax=Parasalinivibrio latis TaxID=2952610 RepID=UPI0030E03168